MLINVIFGGLDLFESTDIDDEPIDKQTRILSIAQDIVYGVSNGKKWTPKHIGLTSSLHQLTRSKKLVNLFHSAGHTLSYRDM